METKYKKPKRKNTKQKITHLYKITGLAGKIYQLMVFGEMNINIKLNGL